MALSFPVMPSHRARWISFDYCLATLVLKLPKAPYWLPASYTASGKSAVYRYQVDLSLKRVAIGHEQGLFMMRHVSPRREQLFRSLRIRLKDPRSDPPKPRTISTTVLSFAHHHIDPIKGERTQIDTEGLSPVSRSGRRKGTTGVIRDPSRSSRSIPTLFGFDDQVLVVCVARVGRIEEKEGGGERTRSTRNRLLLLGGDSLGLEHTLDNVGLLDQEGSGDPTKATKHIMRQPTIASSN